MADGRHVVLGYRIKVDLQVAYQVWGRTGVHLMSASIATS